MSNANNGPAKKGSHAMSKNEIVASISLYGTRETGFGTISQAKGHKGLIVRDLDEANRGQNDSATDAIFRAVEAIRQAAPGLAGDVQITMDVPRGHGLNEPHSARASLSHVPYFGDLKFEGSGVVC